MYYIRVKGLNQKLWKVVQLNKLIFIGQTISEELYMGDFWIQFPSTMVGFTNFQEVISLGVIISLGNSPEGSPTGGILLDGNLPIGNFLGFYLPRGIMLGAILWRKIFKETIYWGKMYHRGILWETILEGPICWGEVHCGAVKPGGNFLGGNLLVWGHFPGDEILFVPFCL